MSRLKEIRERVINPKGGLFTHKLTAAEIAYLLETLSGIETLADTWEHLMPAGNYPEARAAVESAEAAAQQVREVIYRGGIS